MTRTLSREEARAIAVRAAILADQRPAGLLDMVRRLAALRIEQTAVVAESQDHISWSRLGDGFVPGLLIRAVADGRLFEYDWMLRPIEDLPMVLPMMRAPSPYPGVRDWLEVNAPFRREVLARLDDLGPLTSADIPDESIAPWPSSGWTNNRSVAKMLQLMHQHGELAVVRHDGRYRVFDRADNVLPSVEALPADEALRLRNERRLAALGVIRDSTRGSPVEQYEMRGLGEEVAIDGVPGTWRADPTALAATTSMTRTVVLSPFDRLVFDRERLSDLFEWDYLLEMYKPAATRKWGYFALPVLHHDSFVAKVDATADHREGEFRVAAVHEDVTFTTAIRDAVDDAIEELADRLGLDVVRA
ncbi:MAG: crosslink repair DNA glycosylase YcaQ family protein [Pseudolysinimonas sp.]